MGSGVAGILGWEILTLLLQALTTPPRFAVLLLLQMLAPLISRVLPLMAMTPPLSCSCMIVAKGTLMNFHLAAGAFHVHHSTITTRSIVSEGRVDNCIIG